MLSSFLNKPLKSLVFVLVSLISLLFFTGSCFALKAKDVSGEIDGGYRILDVNPAQFDNSFIVYRGDYIKFRYNDSFNSQLATVDDLNYSVTVFPRPEHAPFLKMKQAGIYPFRLGKGGGTINVIELVRPNYIEVTASEAAELLKNINPFILDVRTPDEYEQLHIKGTHLIPVQELQKRLDELESQKHDDIFVYCATGNRSTVAAKILTDAGFKRIYNLRYGVYDWARSGYSYETGK